MNEPKQPSNNQEGISSLPNPGILLLVLFVSTFLWIVANRESSDLASIEVNNEYESIEVNNEYERRNKQFEQSLNRWESAVAEKTSNERKLESLQKELDAYASNSTSFATFPFYEKRTWTSSDFKSKTLATLVNTDGKNVTLVKSNGDAIDVSIAKLSEEDRGLQQILWVKRG